MKKFNIALVIALSLVIGIMTTISASAADLLLDTTINTISIQQDKNGNDYARIIIQEERNLNGIKYNTDVVVMCFGSTVEKAKTYSDGDKFKAVVSQNEYRGRLNYNVVSFIN